MKPDVLSFRDFFANGMKRELPALRIAPSGLPALDLGPGYSPVPGANWLEYPTWNAETDRIPWGDATVGAIHAYHFLEHLRDPRPVLRECQRVLVDDGIMNIVVPYYSAQISALDLDHKARFCEDTWRNLFETFGYAKGHLGWEFDIGFNLIAGIVERNLSLFTQLIRRPRAIDRQADM